MPLQFRLAPRPSLLNRIIFWVIVFVLACFLVPQLQFDQPLTLDGWENRTAEIGMEQEYIERSVRPLDWHNIRNYIKLDYAIIKAVNATSFSKLSKISKMTAYILPSLRWYGVDKIKGKGIWIAQGPRVFLTLLIPYGKIIAVRLIARSSPFKINLKGIRRGKSRTQSQLQIDLPTQQERDLYWLESEWDLEYLGIIIVSGQPELTLQRLQLYGLI